MRGHIHKRKAAHNRVLYYAVVDGPRRPDGRRRQDWGRGYSTRREAEQELTKKIGAIDDGSFVTPTSITLESYVEVHWLESVRSRVKPTTFDSYERTLKNHILPTLGKKRLQGILPSDLTALYGELLRAGRRVAGRSSGTLSAKTVHNVHLIVSKVLGDAVDDGLLQQNAAAKAKPPKPGRQSYQQIRAWTPDELHHFLNLSKDHRFHDAYHLAALTGMRRGEILGLRWEDLDLVQNRLSVRHAIVLVRGKPQSSTPKNHEARVVYLDPDTITMLKHRKAAYNERVLAEGCGPDAEAYVFTREDGRSIHPDNLSSAFVKLATRIQLPRICLHDLRHTHASIALAAGVPIKVVSERLGHASPEFTMRIYQHVLPGQGQEAATAVASAIQNAFRPDIQLADGTS